MCRRPSVSSVQALDGVDGESQPGAILILAQLANQFMDLSEQVGVRAREIRGIFGATLWIWN